MEKGDIILIEFPFTDFSGNKNRPALVLINSKFDVTVAFISSQISQMEIMDVIIKPSEINGLKKESLLRLSKLATLDKNLALGRLGRLESSTLTEVDSNLKKLFQIQ